jgi:hypothetical protein
MDLWLDQQYSEGRESVGGSDWRHDVSRTLCRILVAAAAVLLSPRISQADVRSDVNDIAESYVRLVLEIGLYDDVYVDAYFGPSE